MVKNKFLRFFFVFTLFTILLILFAIVEIAYDSHQSYIRGYNDALDMVLKSIVDSEEVCVGNVILDAPYTAVEHCTFFVMDPNRICIEQKKIVAPVSIKHCHFNVMYDSEDEYRLSARFP